MGYQDVTKRHERNRRGRGRNRAVQQGRFGSSRDPCFGARMNRKQVTSHVQVHFKDKQHFVV